MLYAMKKIINYIEKSHYIEKMSCVRSLSFLREKNLRPLHFLSCVFFFFMEVMGGGFLPNGTVCTILKGFLRSCFYQISIIKGN